MSAQSPLINTAVGAVGFSMTDGRPVAIAAKTVIIATGGLTRLYARNSASSNMNGDGYALALRAGGECVDMEFVQFFPIGHLAPRLIGMDPIMWDPFRYKLGGRLLNADRKEFEETYASQDNRSDGTYILTRDNATYAITKDWFVGLSVSYLPLKTTATIDTTLINGARIQSEAKIKINPVVTFLNVGYRF